MKILADTNILFSALLYPNGGPGRVLVHISENHELVLSDYNISELWEALIKSGARILLGKLPNLCVRKPRHTASMAAFSSLILSNFPTNLHTPALISASLEKQ